MGFGAVAVGGFGAGRRGWRGLLESGGGGQRGVEGRVERGVVERGGVKGWDGMGWDGMGGQRGRAGTGGHQSVRKTWLELTYEVVCEVRSLRSGTGLGMYRICC